MNDGRGQFREESSALGIDLSVKYTSDVAKADFDNDGFIDLAVMTAPYRTITRDDFVLLCNQGNQNHWITVRLIGTISNRDAIGAVIEAKTGEKVQLREVRAGSSFASTESPWSTFGLGKYQQAKITVNWPSGLVEVFPGNPADRVITLVEGTGQQQVD